MCLPNVSKAEVNHPHIYHFYGWHKPSKYGWLWCCFTNIGVFRLAFLIWNWSKQTCLDILGCVMAGRGWHNWRCLLQQVSRSVTKKNLLKLRNTKTGFRVDQLHRPNRKHINFPRCFCDRSGTISILLCSPRPGRAPNMNPILEYFGWLDSFLDYWLLND